MTNPESSLPPGFRFHPTDEELILHYLKNRAASAPIQLSIIAEVDIYKYDPWDLPAKAKFGDREWYFFSPRDRKYPNGVRPNRAAASGYWKATGTDKPIVASSGRYENVGVKKALVFYSGKPPRGNKTNWIMHEYRLAESPNSSNKIHQHIHMKNKDAASSMRLDDCVLCRIYKKNNNQNPSIQSCDQERDYSNLEENYLSNLPELTQQANFKIPKTGSLTELLEDNDYNMLNRFLYENPTDISSTQQQQQQQQQQMGPSLFNVPTTAMNQSNFQDNSQTPLSIPATTNNNTSSTLKRRRTQDEYFEAESSGVGAGAGDLLHPLRSYNSSSTNNSANFSNQMMGIPQYNSNYFSHQLSLNSHLGLH